MINNISLSGFRNFKNIAFDFNEGVNVIVGENASGKTNILESLYLLSTGKSFKARREEEMIGYSCDIARIMGLTSNKSIKSTTGSKNQYTNNNIQTTSLEIILTRGEVDLGNGDKQQSPRKKLLVNRVPKRLIDFAGNFKTVLFGPWDMDLVTSSPSLRRNFMDSVLCQTDREYRRSLLSYEKGLRQRNRLLLRIREEGLNRNQLLFWNQLLIKNGNYITEKREELIGYMNKSQIPISNIKLSTNYQLEYDRSIISEGRLEQYKNEEIASATTLVGPHRDDIQFKIQKSKIKDEDRDLAKYGSRGEQRMGVLWLKMAEYSYIKDQAGENPTLLLDDIFSELDHPHREIVYDLVRNKDFGGQVIITTADEHFVEGVGGRVIRI